MTIVEHNDFQPGDIIRRADEVLESDLHYVVLSVSDITWNGEAYYELFCLEHGFKVGMYLITGYGIIIEKIS